MGAVDILQTTSLTGQRSFVDKFGYNANVDMSEEDIWEVGGIYTFLTAPAILFASCTAASTNTVTIEGLDENWLIQIKDVTLNGQNQVALPGLWRRVHRAFNDTGDDLTGDVYIAETDDLTDGVPDTATKIKLFIAEDEQQTLHALYTIPANKTGYLVRIRWDIESTKSATFKLYLRNVGKVWRLADIFAGESNSIEVVYPMWDKLLPKTDIRMSAIGAASATPISASFDILLVESG